MTQLTRKSPIALRLILRHKGKRFEVGLHPEEEKISAGSETGTPDLLIHSPVL